jgi:phosphohistidine phosphatase
MSKTLYLLRHAKSSWDDPAMKDFDRPLNKRGKKAAPQIGGEMKSRGVRPDAILSSPAKRTRETAKLALEAAGIVQKPTFVEEIYEASLNDLKNVLNKHAGDAASVMLIGHNPGMEELLLYLTGEHEDFPTAALAKIKLDSEAWNKIYSGGGHLEWLIKPRELED